VIFGNHLKFVMLSFRFIGTKHLLSDKERFFAALRMTLGKFSIKKSYFVTYLYILGEQKNEDWSSYR
jgi:hypothetical protein